MVKKIGDKKVGKINPTDVAKEIERAHSVSEVAPVKATKGVQSVSGLSGLSKRGATRVMSLAEREELLRLVSEEAERMFPKGTLPQDKREIIEGAVKMALDSALVEEKD